ncbi:MAG: ubiquinone/menaquinone biosynthesis methyltransferase [Candidatus Hermodarchaeota archaeon]
MNLDKSPHTMIGMFNSVAYHYDVINDVMTAFSHRRTKKVAARFSIFKAGQKALDLATGTGSLAFQLLKEAQGTVVGIDISDKMLWIASARSRRLGMNRNTVFYRVDINNLPFLDEVFDVCTIGYGIRNVQNPLSAMKEILRVTKNNGRFIIIEATPPSNYYIRFLTLFHFRKLAPLIAKFFFSNVQAYNYLAESISQFPKASEFAEIVKRVGWKKVYYYPMYLGAVTIFLAVK